MGQVRREQTRGGIRTRGSLTRRGRARPRWAAAGSRAGYDQAAGQAASASLPRPGMPPPALAGNSATSNYSLRTSRSVPRPRRIQLARHSSIAADIGCQAVPAQTTVRYGRTIPLCIGSPGRARAEGLGRRRGFRADCPGWHPGSVSNSGSDPRAGEIVVRVGGRPQRAGGGNNGTASAIIRSTICAAAGTSAMSPTPQPAYMAMAATSPVVNTVGGCADQRTTSQLWSR